MARTLLVAASMPQAESESTAAMSRSPVAPLLLLEEVRGLLDELAAGRHEALIFMTGNSVASLFEVARELGRHSDLLNALRVVTTACRGPKAAAVLRGLGLRPTFGERGLFTIPRLIYALSRLELAGRSVVRFNGAPGDAIANELRAQRATLREFSIHHLGSRRAGLPD